MINAPVLHVNGDYPEGMLSFATALKTFFDNTQMSQELLRLRSNIVITSVRYAHRPPSYQNTYLTLIVGCYHRSNCLPTMVNMSDVPS